MLTTIEIRHQYFGIVLFSHTCEDNSLKITVEEAAKQEANLRGANLQEADLQGADLRGADLSGADLRRADLSGANLRGANLQEADLQGADLRGANLQEADIDFSNLSFSCCSRMPKTDQRQRVQLAHHFLSWIQYADNATDEEKAIFNALVSYANRFHREDVEKFTPIIINMNDNS